MNKTDFTYVLQNPQALTSEQTDAVKSIIDNFPYFQSARAIYLKGLKDQNSFKYNQELKTTAAYTTDRSVLFDYITSEAFAQNEISQYIKQNNNQLNDIDVEAEDISVKKSTQIDTILSQQINATHGVLDPKLFEPKESRPVKPAALNEPETIKTTSEEKPTPEATEVSKEIPPKKTKTLSEVLNLGKPLQFDNREKHSFNEWLKLSHFKPVQREEEPEPEEKSQDELEKEKKFELIDKFISDSPKITPTKSATQKGNLAKAQMIKPEALMTETLARIYVEQKNYKKAIQSYKILSLKYPEKSSFFANQIKAVEQLREQNK